MEQETKWQSAWIYMEQETKQQSDGYTEQETKQHGFRVKSIKNNVRVHPKNRCGI